MIRLTIHRKDIIHQSHGLVTVKPNAVVDFLENLTDLGLVEKRYFTPGWTDYTLGGAIIATLTRSRCLLDDRYIDDTFYNT